MKLCIPVLENSGLHAATEAHFPHARLLLVFDTDTRLHHHIDLNNYDAQSAEQTMIDALLCASINRHTLRSLVDQNIQVFGCTAQTAAEAITQFENGELEAVTIAGRNSQGGCGCQSDDTAHEHAAEHECCHGHDDAEHECCGGQGHGDHECCGGGHGKDQCGCHDEPAQV